MTDTTDDARQHVAELVSKARVAMLTTTTAEGKRVSRPMGLQEAEFDGASSLDAAGRVHEVTVPALVACGDLDVPLKLQRSAELADALPQGSYRSLPGRAHLPYLEAPDEVAALIAGV